MYGPKTQIVRVLSCDGDIAGYQLDIAREMAATQREGQVIQVGVIRGLLREMENVQVPHQTDLLMKRWVTRLKRWQRPTTSGEMFGEYLRRRLTEIPKEVLSLAGIDPEDKEIPFYIVSIQKKLLVNVVNICAGMQNLMTDDE